MKERDLKREWETAKARGEIQIAFKATKEFNDAFAAKCAENGTNKNAVLRQFAYEYTYGEKAAEMAKPARQRKTPDRGLER